MRKFLTLLIGGLFLGRLSGCLSTRMTMNSRAMEPTLPLGSSIAVDTAAYQNRSPERYDVVIFEYKNKSSAVPIQQPPDGAEICYRIIGLPGETVEIVPSGILINGAPAALPSGLRYNPAPISEQYRRFNSLTLPADGYFVLGDNTDKALDSRYWGFIREEQILGKVEQP